MDSSAMNSMERWDLAPGEPISQRPPPRALHGSPLCPVPTLDTEDFIVQNAFSEDCSPVDSMAEYGLAPGEVRSQVPSRAFYASQSLQCPRPTLDTQEFEIKIESGDSESDANEDSLACWDLAPGECKSQSPALDPWSAPKQFCPPSLETQEFEKNQVIPLVEDSLASWDSGPGETRSEGVDVLCNNLESRSFPSSVSVPGITEGTTPGPEQRVGPLSNSTLLSCVIEADVRINIGSNLVGPLCTSARKSSLPVPCSPQGNSGKSKQVQLDPAKSVPGEFNSVLLPVQLSGRSSRGECHGKVSVLKFSKCSRKQDREAVEPENFGLAPFSPPKHTPLTPARSTMFDIKPPANGFEDNPCRTAPERRRALVEITNAKAVEAKSSKALNSRKRGLGSPTKESLDSRRNVASDGVASTSRDGLSDNHGIVLTNPVRRPAVKSMLCESHESGRPMKGTEVDAKSLVKKTDCRAQAKVQTTLNFQLAFARKVEQPSSDVDAGGWRCPKAGKIFVPTPKQRSLDRWIS